MPITDTQVSAEERSYWDQRERQLQRELGLIGEDASADEPFHGLRNLADSTRLDDPLLFKDPRRDVPMSAEFWERALARAAQQITDAKFGKK